MLAADGVDGVALTGMKNKLLNAGAQVKIIAPHHGEIKGSNGKMIPVDKSLLNAASVLFAAVYIPGGAESIKALIAEPDAIHFINQAYKHCKAIAADKESIPLLKASYINEKAMTEDGKGIVTDGNAKKFIDAIAKHRFWEREEESKVPA